ncbi:hypothetical protein E2C01_066609 [Portunus trituberculatus]|uniref:Uncharacterized protein n=1 Tax=Portunus trituberculatus TaxID=210409 RepID=A0A5B7HRC0_PORTR|nr:hypothetical protein [Portunus trituberculatus]
MTEALRFKLMMRKMELEAEAEERRLKTKEGREASRFEDKKEAKVLEAEESRMYENKDVEKNNV